MVAKSKSKKTKSLTNKVKNVTIDALNGIVTVEVEKVLDLPILTSMGVAIEGDHFISYVIKTQGTKVVSIVKEETEIKAVAITNAKIAFNKQFVLQDL